MVFLTISVGARCPACANWCKFSCNPGVSGANLVLAVQAPTWEGVHKSCRSQNPPLFSPVRVKSPLQMCNHTPFFFEVFVMVFYVVIFSSVVRFFALLVRFGANFLLDQCSFPRPVTYFTVWGIGTHFLEPNSHFCASCQKYSRYSEIPSLDLP